jgi:hypothetical protein
MAFSLPSLETIATVWNWSKANLDTWIRSVRSLNDVLSEVDLESRETLMSSLEFSAFSILAAMIVDVPVWITFSPSRLTVPSAVADFLLYYVNIPLAAAAQRWSSALVRGRASMHACFVATLFATAYWPLYSLLDLIAETDERLSGAVYKNSLMYFSDVISWPMSSQLHLVFYIVASMAMCSFFFVKLIAAARTVHKVGTMRAAIICSVTFFIWALLSFVFSEPVFQALFFGHEHSSL